MALFDLLLEQLAKEIQEAPGWIFLIIAANMLLMLDSVSRTINQYFEVGPEKGTVATIAAIVLFLAGDALDTIVFPRERETKRAEKLLKSVMLALAAVGLFVVIKRNWVWSFWFGYTWLTILALHEIRRRPPGSRAMAEPKPTGWKHLEPVALERARQDVKRRLQIANVYQVSKELTKKARLYTWSWIWFQNELSKFVRSLVVPFFVMGGLLALHKRMLWAVLAFVAADWLLRLYAGLKASHMRALYRSVAERNEFVQSPKSDYSTFDLANGVRVFCWSNSVVASGDRLRP